MGNLSKLRQKILSGGADNNIEFGGMCQLLQRLGFEERIRGSHHIFTRQDVQEILNLQPRGNHAKAYQVKQVRKILVRYGLGAANVDQV